MYHNNALDVQNVFWNPRDISKLDGPLPLAKRPKKMKKKQGKNQQKAISKRIKSVSYIHLFFKTRPPYIVTPPQETSSTTKFCTCLWQAEKNIKMLNFISFRAIPHVMKQNDFSCDPHMGSSLASTTVSMYAVVEQIKQHNVMSKSFKTKIFNICFKKTQKRKLPFFLILCCTHHDDSSRRVYTMIRNHS